MATSTSATSTTTISKTDLPMPTGLPSITGLFVPGLSQTCRTGVAAAVDSLDKTCGFTPFIDKVAAHASVSEIAVDVLFDATFLASFCSPACTAVTGTVSTSLNAACGAAPIFNGVTYTNKPVDAAAIGSYLSFASTVLCVKDRTTQAFCAPQVGPLVAGIISNTLQSNDTSVVCSTCYTDELAAASSKTDFVDFEAVKGAVVALQQVPAAVCTTTAVATSATTTATAAGATQTVAGSGAAPVNAPAGTHLVAALATALAAASAFFAFI